MPSAERPTVIALLLGLRGLSLLLIVASELAAVGVLPGEFGAGLGEIGLMIFVVISGFVLALRHIHDRCDRHALVDFARARARHVLPAYAVAVVASLVIEGWWDEWPYRFHSVAAVVRAVFLLDAPGALWIVPVLAQCYLLFVIAWWLWSRGWSIWTLVALALAVPIPAVLGWYPHDGHGLAVVVPYFVVGMALGTGWPATIEPLMVRHLGPVSVVGGIAFVLACINVPAVRISHGWTLGHSILAATWFDPLNALVVIALIVAAATRPIALAVLGTAPLLLLGQYWLPLYLLAPVLAAALPD